MIRIATDADSQLVQELWHAFNEEVPDAPWRDDDEIRARITSLRGLGPWTAEWFLARHLARPRAWPVGDIALQKAVRVLYGSTVEEMGPRLDPFQNLSAHYLLTGARTAAP